MLIRIVCAVALAGACSSLFAADAPPLTMEEAVDRALAANPSLGAGQAAIDAAGNIKLLGVTVLTDDERPVVFYGEQRHADPPVPRQDAEPR